MKKIKASELIINPDGTIFHLHLKPENLAENIILVGDPGRVKLVSSFFDNIESTSENREFVSATGTFRGKRITALSTGIGTDNIDIVVNELDALVNIDLKTRTVKEEHTALNIVRIGTSGALQGDIPVNSYVASQRAIGFDGLMNFYAGRETFADIDFEKAFKEHTDWNPLLTSPYVVESDSELFKKIVGEDMVPGVTISAPGFYGPQGRELRLPTADPELNDKIESFRFNGMKITNYEMECSAIYGLSHLLGHHALTICAIIANRVTREANENYKPVIKNLVETVLERIVM
ncbi:nucleoside phosphorylase [Prolixibacter denitrificans]|uniref:Uridine phosphorylase n=1 Tax=Prolixibacter denitrificans TaxID=1541063 RepID=A0A2P8CE25_9BACT|nr:nucleoside phosphorylase [Prolixibacter denitrificans]PSK83234.1 uridine phosphorylase [Prolixibacter denitrificans]GET21883.1 phosphorylase [Prolixibacter denitrificans]